MIEPIERTVVANGLAHGVVTWEPEERAAGEAHEDAPTLVLCHGFLDQAYGFDRVARRLAAVGIRCVAFDFRGHGRTEWVGAGGYYHFPDYVLDLDCLLTALGLARVHLLGHSMGSTVAAMFAGTRPERVDHLVLVEGLGPPAPAADDLPGRFRTFLDGVQKAAPRRTRERPMASVDEALARMRATHPELDDELGRFLAEKATREAEDGGRVFRFDPLHRTMAPVPFRPDAFRAFLRAIRAPTLVVFGDRGMRVPDEDERLACIAGATRVVLPDVGHMVHWFADEALAARIAHHVVPIREPRFHGC